MNVLIAGFGILGRTLCEQYLDRGDRVTALAYSSREFRELPALSCVEGEHPNLRTIACDVTKPDQLQGVCDGIDILISCIGITRMKGNLTHMDVDYQGNINLLREAEKSGVKKFGLISPAGVEQGRQNVPLLEAKYLFKKELKESSVQWVIFRSGGFFPDLAGMLDMAKKGPLYVIGNGKSRSTPVDVRDLSSLVVEEMDQACDRILSIGGPEDMSWNDVCMACFEQCGLKPHIIRVPKWLCEVTLWVLKPFSKSTYAMGQLILFMSTRDLPTEKRGTRSFADYLRELS